MVYGQVIAAFLLLGLTCVQAGTCKSGRIFLGSINETYPQHVNKIGVYERVEGAGLFGRPSFRHESSGHWLYYRSGALGQGLWVVGPKLGEDPAAFGIQSDAADPGAIRLGLGKAWSVQTDRGWVREPRLKAVCVDEAFGVCSTRTLDVFVFGQGSQQHDVREGSYDLQEETFNLRPVYKHRDNGEYLFYNGGAWFIGPSAGSATFSLLSLDYAFMPELIVQPWISASINFASVRVKIICHGNEESAANTSSTAAAAEVTTVPAEVPEQTNTSSTANSEEGSVPARSAPCQPNPCQHGGTCIPAPDGTFACTCPRGYTGVDCQDTACGPPPSKIVHGRLRNVTKQGFLGLAYYDCDDGFISRTGHVIAVCGSSRRWLDVPECAPSLTRLLNPVPNPDQA